jgi:hypothetical protein
MTLPPKPPAPDHFDIQTEESTLGRFNDLLGRVLGANREEVRIKEKEFKNEQRKKRNAKRKADR